MDPARRAPAGRARTAWSPHDDDARREPHAEHRDRLVPPRPPRPRPPRAHRGARGGGCRGAAVRVRRAAARRSMAVREPDLVHARERRGAGRVPRRARGAAPRRVRAGPRTSSRRSPGSSAPSEVYVTRDAAPYGRRRDRAVADRLAADGIAFRPKRGLYVHEPDEVRKADGGPFTVYSPFRRAWQALDRRPVLPAPDRIPGPHGAAGRGSRPDPVPGGLAAHRRPRADPRAGRGRPPVIGWRAGSTARSTAYASSRNRLGPRRHLAAVAGPALGPAVAERGRRPGRRGGGGPPRLRAGARLARVLRARPVAPPARAARAVPAGVRGPRLGGRRRRLPRVGRGTDRLPDRGRGHAPAAGVGLRAQPGAHDRGLVPGQGPAARLAARRGRVHAPPDRR